MYSGTENNLHLVPACNVKFKEQPQTMQINLWVSLNHCFLEFTELKFTSQLSIEWPTVYTHQVFIP